MNVFTDICTADTELSDTETHRKFIWHNLCRHRSFFVSLIKCTCTTRLLTIINTSNASQQTFPHSINRVGRACRPTISQCKEIVLICAVTWKKSISSYGWRANGPRFIRNQIGGRPRLQKTFQFYAAAEQSEISAHLSPFPRRLFFIFYFFIFILTPVSFRLSSVFFILFIFISRVPGFVPMRTITGVGRCWESARDLRHCLTRASSICRKLWRKLRDLCAVPC